MKAVYWRKPRPGPIGEDPPADEQANVPDDSEGYDVKSALLELVDEIENHRDVVNTVPENRWREFGSSRGRSEYLRELLDAEIERVTREEGEE